MPYLKKKQTVRRRTGVVARVASAVKGRYFKGSGYSRPKLGRIIKDVSMLKSMINSEKKTFPQFNAAIPVGQVSANVNGYYVIDITPTPSQGTTSTTRNGNSIKLHSSFMRFQFAHQTNTSNPVRLKIVIVLVKGAPQTASTFPLTMYEPNPFVTGASIVDYNSSYNADFFATFKVLRTKTLLIKADNITGQNSITDISLPMKWMRGKGHHIRFSTDGSQTISNGQLLCVLLADNGNISGTASTLSGLPINGTGPGTGVFMNYNFLHYYYDN